MGEQEQDKLPAAMDGVSNMQGQTPENNRLRREEQWKSGTTYLTTSSLPQMGRSSGTGWPNSKLRSMLRGQMKQYGRTSDRWPAKMTDNQKWTEDVKVHNQTLPS
jgi:hypothetical protein